MQKDPVVQVGSAVLRQIAKSLSKKDITSRKIAGIVKRMKTVLTKEGFGVAIAAPQIGESLRIFVIAGKAFSIAKENKNPLPDKVFINPEITIVSKSKKEMTEGCLSVRNKYGAVPRHEKVSIKALDETGKSLSYHASGLVGQIFQHEIDHLNGILYIDKATAVVDDEEWKELKEKRTKEKHG